MTDQGQLTSMERGQATSDGEQTESEEGQKFKERSAEPQRPNSAGSSCSVLPPIPVIQTTQVFKTSEGAGNFGGHVKFRKYNTLVGSAINPELTILQATGATFPLREKALVGHPLSLPPMPEVLVFHGWFREGHCSARNSFVHIRFSFETGTQKASLTVDGARMVIDPTVGSRPATAWDLHVGAIVVVLGRRLELRKAELSTQLWLDGQARQMLADKRVVEDELRKFCHVGFKKDHENVTMPCHKPHEVPRVKELNPYEASGGRVNLRRLAAELDELLLRLRRYRKRLPRAANQAAGPACGSGAEENGFPGSWSTKAESKAGQSLEPTPKSTNTGDKSRLNYLDWLKGIPLASSAAGITPSPEPELIVNDGSMAAYASTTKYVRAVDRHTPPPTRPPAGDEVDAANPFSAVLGALAQAEPFPQDGQ
uniref:Uncharacterized protein n=1 Tax=Tetraselmis sp. GSL018 TaxID=582737 RepID=A0A061RJX4_9CHLO